jgi:hypothetical protein
MRSVMRVLFALFVLRNFHNPPRRISKRGIWSKLLGWVCSKLTTLKTGHCDCAHARNSATRSQIAHMGLSTIRPASSSYIQSDYVNAPMRARHFHARTISNGQRRRSLNLRFSEIRII